MSSSENLNLACKLHFSGDTNFQDYQDAAKIIREQDAIIKRMSMVLNQIDAISCCDQSINTESPTFKKISEYYQFICEMSEYCRT